MQISTTLKNLISRKFSYKKAKGMRLFLIAIPFLVYIFAFSYVPLFGWIYSLYDFKPLLGMNLSMHEFVGFENFKQIFIQSETLFRVLKNTLTFAGLGMMFSPAPVILAILLNEVKSSKFKRIIQTTTTFPNFISWIIVFGIAFSFFSNDGLVNLVIKKMGGTPPAVGLLGNVDAVYIFHTLLGMWKGLGWGAIIYIAAITGIDHELYNAVKIDGANRIQAIRHVTIPGIMPTYIVLFILGIGSILDRGFDQYFIFNNALVNSKLTVLDLYVYQLGIILNEYSFSIAFGITKTFVGVILLTLANVLAKRVRGSSIF